MAKVPDSSEALDALAQDFIKRARDGELVTIEQYALAHPQLADEIREVFPVLVVFEDLKPAIDVEEDESLPERIADFDIVRRLGSGGMGRVYEARQGERRVALKVMHPHLSATGSYHARFVREAEAGRRVDHPNVVRTLGAGTVTQDGLHVPYLVMEFVRGQNLRALISEVGAVGDRLARRIAMSVCEGLAAIHEVGVVHRDIKPENVIITDDETVKIMDLGIALVHDYALSISQVGQFVGSLMYAAPEQIHGRGVDARADLYATGLLTYELACGVHALQAMGSEGVVAAGPLQPSQLPPSGASQFLDAVVRDLLAADVADRPSSAATVALRLREGEDSQWWKGQERAHQAALQQVTVLSRVPTTPLVGREAELAQLDECARSLYAGTGHTVLLLGEGGIGKSRLVYSWLTRMTVSSPSIRVLVARHESGTRYATPPILDALRTALDPLDPAADVRQRLRDTEYLGGLIAQYLVGDAPPDLTAERIAHGLSLLLRSMAADQPLVVVWEDLHFASADARALFGELARSLADAPLLWVGTARPADIDSYLDDLRVGLAPRCISLVGLDEAACRQLAEDFLGDASVSLSDIGGLIERSDGNPLFLQELSRALQDDGFSKTAGGSITGVPSSIGSILLARARQALSEDEYDLLALAACAGFDFDPVLIARAAGRGELATLKQFARIARRQGWILASDRRYRFHHHLLQEALYGDLHPSLREQYHVAYAESLAASGTPTPDVARELALHFLDGAAPEKAAPFATIALTQLVAGPANSDAAGFAERVMAHADLLPKVDQARALALRARHATLGGRPADARAHIESAMAVLPEDEHDLRDDLGLDLGNTLYALGDADAAREQIQKTGMQARERGNWRVAVLASIAMFAVYFNASNMESAASTIEEAETLLGDRHAPDLLCSIRRDQSMLDFSMGKMDAGDARIDEAMRLARESGSRSVEIRCRAEYASALWQRGNLQEALESIQDVARLEREAGRHVYEAHALANVAFAKAFLGQLDEAKVAAERALSIGVAIENPEVEMDAHSRMGTILSWQGRLGDAITHVDRALELAEATGRTQSWSTMAIDHARTRIQLARFEQARAMIERVRAACHEDGTVMTTVFATSSSLAEAEGRIEDAVASFEATLTKNEPTGMALGHSSAVIALARCQLMAGRIPDALANIERALDLALQVDNESDALLARVYAALLPSNDGLSARVALERGEALLVCRHRMEAHFMLWHALGSEEHLERAREELTYQIDHAPPQDRAGMRERVYINRHILEGRRLFEPIG